MRTIIVPIRKIVNKVQPDRVDFDDSKWEQSAKYHYDAEPTKDWKISKQWSLKLYLLPEERNDHRVTKQTEPTVGQI